MAVTVKKEGENKYLVFSFGKNIGAIETCENPLYAQNLYLKPELSEYDPALSTELFSVLKALVNRPLEVMAESENAVPTYFLKAGGFNLKRRYFESEVSAVDFIGGTAPFSHFDTAWRETPTLSASSSCEIPFCFLIFEICS